ncbi:hypothetical protein N783_06405 [Pontibacillus marinus BH030004 = DSM 16465]|uniref:Uncharacterized protein n=1 Tax=Pontibacillus marinus BH030004 = DSM 16465 TaxID=1385511 RepID=A0A0A5HHK0_9BACI|nr:hypothetical protein N783_06405 [Pontibacillus marinus BH030004 = DSM 16465]
MDIKLIDWKLLSFISTSLIYEHWLYMRIPKIYYWSPKSKKNNGKENPPL